MSEATTTPTPATPNDLPPAAAAPVESAEAAKGGDAAPPKDGAERRILHELAQERKARKQLQSQVEEFENAKKSDSERLAEQLQALKAEAATAKADALRMRVAAEMGLPADLHEFLVGDDEEVVRAKAQKLMAATAAATGPRSPAPDPTQGAKQGAGKDQLTRADMARMTPQEIVAAQEAGRFDDLMAGRTQ